MAFNYGDIFQNYLQGASFVANSLDRAEARRRQQEEDELQTIAGKGLEIFAPKYDKDGKLMPRTSGDIFNDPKTLELANHPYMKSARMQGITDPNVKDVRYVGGTPLEDGQRVVPIVEQLNEDGDVISRGPLTEGRSRDGKAAVTPITVDAMFNHLAGEVYRRNPTLGKELMTRSREQALAGLQTQYRNAASPEEREQLVQVATSYGYSPESLMKDSGAPIEKPDLRLGVKMIQGPDGSYTYQKDPGTEALRTEIQDRDNKEALAQRRTTMQQDLDFKVQSAPTENTLEANSAKARGLAELEFKEVFGPRIREEAAKSQRSTAAVEEEMRAKYFNPILERKVKEIGATTQATAGANLSSAPTVKQTNDVLNPVRAQDEKGLLQAREVLNPSAVPALLSKGASASEDAVLQYAPKLTTDDQKGLYAALARRVEAGDPAAIPALRTLKRVMHDAAADAGGKGEAPKPAKYDETGVDKWTVDLPDDERRKVRLQGKQVFEDLQVASPVAEGSPEAAIRNIAVAEALRIGLPTHALPLENWVGLQRDPAYANGVGDAREFLDEIHTPIVELSKQQGLSMSPRVLSQTERLAVGLKARGIANSDAVTKALEVEKNPALVDKIVRLFPEGASPAEREKVFLDTLAADLKTSRASNLKSTLREGADYTFGGGMMR